MRQLGLSRRRHFENFDAFEIAYLMDNFDALRDYVLSHSIRAQLFPKRTRKVLEKVLESWPANGTCMASNDNTHKAVCQRAGFSPMIWAWLAKIVIELLLQWLANRGIGTIQGARQELARFAFYGATESE